MITTAAAGTPNATTYPSADITAPSPSTKAKHNASAPAPIPAIMVSTRDRGRDSPSTATTMPTAPAISAITAPASRSIR
ncbi:hypothetical protein GCM10028864_60530 [Microlunatus parietis]